LIRCNWLLSIYWVLPTLLLDLLAEVLREDRFPLEPLETTEPVRLPALEGACDPNPERKLVRLYVITSVIRLVRGIPSLLVMEFVLSVSTFFVYCEGVRLLKELVLSLFSDNLTGIKVFVPGPPYSRALWAKSYCYYV
jgi:hypothetical protein